MLWCGTCQQGGVLDLSSSQFLHKRSSNLPDSIIKVEARRKKRIRKWNYICYFLFSFHVLLSYCWWIWLWADRQSSIFMWIMPFGKRNFCSIHFQKLDQLSRKYHHWLILGKGCVIYTLFLSRITQPFMRKSSAYFEKLDQLQDHPSKRDFSQGSVSGLTR